MGRVWKPCCRMGGSGWFASGPGLGTGAREAGLLAAALGAGRAERPLSLVLDADALTILSREAGLFGALHDGCVLTPHGGEFARLFPDIAAKLDAPAIKGPAYSKVDATREAAARAGCVVLFKGADTVIAAPDGRCAINSAHYDRAAPWLATAGSGDVLAGVIAGLLARGLSPFDAACTGGLAACRMRAGVRAGADCRRPARDAACGVSAAGGVRQFSSKKIANSFEGIWRGAAGMRWANSDAEFATEFGANSGSSCTVFLRQETARNLRQISP